MNNIPHNHGRRKLSIITVIFNWRILIFSDVKKEHFIEVPPVESSTTHKSFMPSPPCIFFTLKVGGKSNEKKSNDKWYLLLSHGFSLLH